MNEVLRTQPEDQLHRSVTLRAELNNFAHELDPYRKTAQARFSNRGNIPHISRKGLVAFKGYTTVEDEITVYHSVLAAGAGDGFK